MKVILRPSADAEFVELLDWIRSRDHHAAKRVHDAVLSTLDLLAANPEMGGLYSRRSRRLRGLRIIGVMKYPQFVILYLPTTDTIDILHVVRGRRRLSAVVADFTG